MMRRRPSDLLLLRRVALCVVLAFAGQQCWYLGRGVVAVTLSTSSRWIVDEAGRRVKLACVNWPSHLEPVVAEGLGRQPVDAISKKVASLGFNCVRLTYPIALATNASLSSLTVRQSLLAHGLAETVAGVGENNPGFLDLTLIESFRAVVDSLGENDVMVILDNHVSQPGWCCADDDGNGFFGDRYFDSDVWVQGLANMAALFAGVPNVVGMSLRNELRGPRQNHGDWYRYMQRGAEAVHAANPAALVVMGGLGYDTDLSFLGARPVDVSFAAAAAERRKLVFELHWYSFSDARAWEAENANEVCGRVARDFLARRGGFLLDAGLPLFLSEFGGDTRGGSRADDRYFPCAAAVAAELDLDWALWALQGSYALRQGVPGTDEVYGVLDWSWSKPRNVTALARVQSLQRPLRGPGYDEARPYTVLYHPLTGRCVVRRAAAAAASATLELGPCNETEAWAYTHPSSTLALQGATTPPLCLRAEGSGRPARLTSDAAGGAAATWRLVSDSAMHVAVNATTSSSPAGQDGTGGLLCLDIGDDRRTVVTNPCRCLHTAGDCDPQTQWFKLVTSTRAPSTTTTTATAAAVARGVIAA
ncbi:glycosyl hydrolase 5 family protein [Oryza brachyantha]|uniref:glycosyl hydrolase 5 family protein n=1 Tax=Oryza brachyantha TaxID=4533 RepID=UPI001ADBBC72|nr:glycosyl hydrolase 5 family protein [Oryza brachyantha]